MPRKKIVKVWIVRNNFTGCFDGGVVGYNRHSICTEAEDGAFEYDDDDLKEAYPDGIPEGWEKILVMEF